MAFFQISLTRKQKRCILGPKSKFEKKIFFQWSWSSIFGIQCWKNPKIPHPRIGKTGHQKISFGPRIQFLKLKIGLNSVLACKCQFSRIWPFQKKRHSNEIFIYKKVRKWLLWWNNEKIFLKRSTTDQNFRLFRPKTKNFSFKQLFLMPFFEAKY